MKAYDYFNHQASFEAKSIRSLKRSCGFISSSLISYNTNNISSYTDIDKLREEIIQCKMLYNKKNQDYHDLLIETKKLENSKLQFSHLIEDLIPEANKNLIASSQDIIGLDDELFISKITNNISHESSAKIFNQHLLLRMKNEIYQLREDLKKKEEEIFEWKTKTKVVKYKSLDNQLVKTSLELAKVTDKYHKANKLQRGIKSQADSLINKLSVYQKEFKKQKIRLDKSNRAISIIERLNEGREYRSHNNLNFNYNNSNNNNSINNNEATKNKERNLEYLVKSHSNRIKTLENELNNLRERNIELEIKVSQYKDAEKKELENKGKEQWKEEIKRKDIKIKQLEKSICDYYIELEREKNKKPPVRNYIKVEKENRTLKFENNKLTKINEDLKSELLKLKMEYDIDQEKNNDNEKIDEINDEKSDNDKKTHPKESKNELTSLVYTKIEIKEGEKKDNRTHDEEYKKDNYQTIKIENIKEKDKINHHIIENENDKLIEQNKADEDKEILKENDYSNHNDQTQSLNNNQETIIQVEDKTTLLQDEIKKTNKSNINNEGNSLNNLPDIYFSKKREDVMHTLSLNNDNDYNQNQYIFDENQAIQIANIDQEDLNDEKDEEELNMNQFKFEQKSNNNKEKITNLQDKKEKTNNFNYNYKMLKRQNQINPSKLLSIRNKSAKAKDNQIKMNFEKISNNNSQLSYKKNDSFYSNKPKAEERVHDLSNN